MEQIKTYTNLQIYQYDPTRTLTLRNMFVREMNKRFNQLIKVIRKAIVEEDCFGLSDVRTYVEPTSPGYKAFDYTRISQKVDAFMEWLKEQERKGLLEIAEYERIGSAVENAWTNIFIEDSYKRGLIRARAEMRKAGYDVPTVQESGGIDALMGLPFHVDRVGLVFTRAFTQLQGITAAMDAQISTILAQGLVDGDAPRVLARKLVATINGSGMGELGITDSLGRFIPAQRRARMLARTEIIRAHHLANIQEYMNWEVQGIVVVAEWSTAGDERVCDRCAALHGNRYTLKEIEHMIPLHPNCRCIAVPVKREEARGVPHPTKPRTDKLRNV
jgi:SPP1 gp7 family putative phage head morphogenesis protein